MDQETVASGLAPKSRKPIKSGSEYIDSLRNRKLQVYLMGELIKEPVEHPIIRPSINAVAQTYDLANENPELASAVSPFTGERVNRFLHISASSADLVMQNQVGDAVLVGRLPVDDGEPGAVTLGQQGKTRRRIDNQGRAEGEE